MRDLLTTVLVIGRSTTRFWLLDDLLHPLAASWRKQRPARNPPNTMKLEAGSKLQIPLPISWCRAGVSASIEDRDGKGRATPSKVPSTGERTHVATRVPLLDNCCGRSL